MIAQQAGDNANQKVFGHGEHGKVGRIDIRLHHVPIAKIHLSSVVTPRKTFVQIPSARIPS
jgi:hypothetical protein